MMLSYKQLLSLTLLSATAVASFMGADTAIPDKEEPRVRLRISGMLDGRLEPCGCASGQLGGLARRVFNLKSNKNYDLLIEGGNIVKGGTVLDVQKFSTTLMILDMADYQAIGIGPTDLELPLNDLVDFFSVSRSAPITSDLKPLLPIPEWKATAFREFTAADTKVRVASLTMSKPAGKTADAFALIPPKEAWTNAMAGCAQSTLRIAIVHAKPESMATIANLSPRPDLLIGITESVNEPLNNPDPVDGVPIVYPGIRGRMLLDVTLARIDGEPRLTRYRVVHLKGSETLKGAMEDKDTRAMILAHRHDVKDLGIREAMARQKKTKDDRKYVGSEVCGDCHEESYEIWEKSKHSKAWETLEKAEGKRYPWPITHYPDCISCHTDGYGYESGFINPEKTPELGGVGCESCHGPGSVHIEEETPESIIRSEPGDCLRCHDFEQTPNFNWKKMWKHIEHYEK